MQLLSEPPRYRCYVVHSWDASFQGTVAALQQHFGVVGKNSRDDDVVWMDVLCLPSVGGTGELRASAVRQAAEAMKAVKKVGEKGRRS